MIILFLASAKSVHTIKWVNALAERRHKVYLAYNKNDSDKRNQIHPKVKLIELKFGGMLGYYLNAVEVHNIYLKIRPNVVNAHYASGYGTLARISKISPLILSVWGSDVYEFPYKNKLFYNILKSNLKYADMIASTSNCMAKQVKRLLNEEVNIVVTPFGVDLIDFCERKNKSNSNDEIIIGCVKALDKNYGIKYLIYAIRVLINHLNENGNSNLAEKIRCNIYGDGKQREELENLIIKLKLSKIISLFGKIPHEDVPKVLRKMDIFCVTSLKESFGVAVVEAEAVGLPVVASDAEGFCEVVENGKTGIIVKRKDIDRTAKALEKLVINKKLREEMGQNGRKKAENFYDWDKNVNHMELCYRKLMKKDSKR